MRITTVLASLALLAVCAHGIGLDEPKYLVQSSISRNPLLLPLLKNLDTRFIKDDLVQVDLTTLLPPRRTHHQQQQQQQQQQTITTTTKKKKKKKKTN